MKGIEKSFLSNWSGWDEVDTGDLQFYAVTLNDETKAELTRRGLSDNQLKRMDSMYFSSQSSKVDFYNLNGEVVYTNPVKLVFA
jgi:hypothetical protein